RLRAVGREDIVRRRHAEWFRDVVAGLRRDLAGDQPARCFERFGEVFDELRAALRWSLGHDTAIAADLVHHATFLSRMSLRLETTSWAQEVLARLAETDPDYPVALAAAAVGWSTSGRLDEAYEAASRALRIDPDGRGALLATEAMIDVTLY